LGMEECNYHMYEYERKEIVWKIKEY
jgi:hypothetical protein